MSKKLFSWGKALPMLGIGLLAAGIVSFVGGSTSSAHDRGQWHGETKYFLKVAGIPGSSTDSKHQGEIELNSYRFLEDEPDAPAEEEMTAAAANADFGDNNLRFLADASKASPLLFAKATTGEAIADATLSVRKGKSTNDYLVFKMTDVVVSSYQNNGNDDQDPTDEVVFDYATLEVTHNEGTMLKKGWNFKNKLPF
jgi:type VI secretion system secreted protein Hcp